MSLIAHTNRFLNPFFVIFDYIFLSSLIIKSMLIYIIHKILKIFPFLDLIPELTKIYCFLFRFLNVFLAKRGYDPRKGITPHIKPGIKVSVNII